MKYLREGIVATRKGGKMKVYLAGPIHDLPDDKCKDWREYAKEKLECETLDPMRRDFRGMEEEAMAVIYAQHWAESDAHPDPEAVQRLQQAYGVEKTEAFHLMLRMIRMGNLLGNSWDYLIYRISFGRWGG